MRAVEVPARGSLRRTRLQWLQGHPGAPSLLGALQDWHQWSASSQIQVCVYIHQSVAKKCVEYLAELARHNYVTPKSYLELLNIFSILIGQKKQELKTARNRMKSGLDKVGWGGALWATYSCPWFCPCSFSPDPGGPAWPFSWQPTVFKWVASSLTKRAAGQGQGQSRSPQMFLGDCSLPLGSTGQPGGH